MCFRLGVKLSTSTLKYIKIRTFSWVYYFKYLILGFQLIITYHKTNKKYYEEKLTQPPLSDYFSFTP
jgi:hypothetical protein